MRGRIANKKVWKALNNKWIIVTGANDGIGKGLVLGLAKRKQKIILVGRNEVQLKQVQEEISNLTTQTKVVVLDYLNLPDLEAADPFKDLEIGMLINNAGASSEHPDYFFGDLRNENIIKVNVTSTISITQHVLKKMVNSKFGIILNIGSTLSVIPSPFLSTYSATKAFLRQWSLSMNYELSDLNIHIECAMPGLVCSKMSQVRRTGFFVPSAEVFAESVLQGFGGNSVSIPHVPHLLTIVISNLLPTKLIGKMLFFRMKGTRELALNKKNKRS